LRPLANNYDNEIFKANNHWKQQLKHSLYTLAKEFSARSVLSHCLNALIGQIGADLIQHICWLHISSKQTIQNVTLRHLATRQSSRELAISHTTVMHIIHGNLLMS